MNNDNDPSAIKGLTTGVAEGGGGGEVSSASQEDTSVNTSMASSSRFSIVSSFPQPPPRQPPLLQSNRNSSANANSTISHDQSRRRRQRYSSSSSSRQQQQLYHYQIRILLYTTFFSTIFFLFFFLNLMAFLTLFFGLSSFTMLGYTLYSYLLFLQNDASDGILFRLLPSSLQDYLQYTSPHEAMTGGDGMSSFLHDRWYWMYLIPGLTSEQMDALVEQRLSDRQREMAYGPGGVARLFLPDQVYRLIAPPPVAAGESESGGGGVLVRRSDDSGDRIRQMRLIHGSDSTGTYSGTGSDSRRRRRSTRDNHERSMVMRITEDGRHGIPLPVIEERDDGDGSIINNDDGMDNDHDGPIIQLIDDEEEDGEEQEQVVTMQDAFLGIVQNARNIIMSSSAPVDNTNNGITTAVTSIDTDAQRIQRHAHIMEEYNDLSWDEHDEDIGHRDHNQGNVHAAHDSESETSDLGIDVSANDFTGGMNDGQLSRLGRFLRLRLPAATSARITGMDTTSSSIRSHHTATESHDHDDLPPRVVTMITTVHHDENTLINNHHRRQHPEQQSQQEQGQQDVSGEEIINQALSTMVDNYTNSAREAVTNAITDATVSFVESTTPTLIRAGNWMASFATAGLLGLYTASHVNVRPIGIGSGIGRGGGSSRRLVGEGRTERYMETGLLSTMAMGVFTTGGAYLARWLTRRYMTGHRDALMDKGERKK